MRDFLEMCWGFVVILAVVILITVVVMAPFVVIGVAIDKKACDNIERVNGGEFEFMYSFPNGCLTMARDGRWVPVSSIVTLSDGE